jgi:hypothetical protein
MAVSLVTVAEVRAFLQKPELDQQQDEVIGRLVESASKAVITYTEREFAPVTGPGTDRLFWYCGVGVVSLTPYDLQTLEEIKIDTTGGVGGRVLAETEYRLHPRPPKHGVINWLRLDPATAAPSTRFAEREVTITGTWGFPAVPDDVKHWTAVTVAEWLRREVSAFSAAFSIDEGRLERPEALPSAARAGLHRYRM